MRKIPILCLATLGIVAPLRYANASFTTAPSAAHSISTATLAAPSNASASVVVCVPLATRTVRISWTATASTWSDGYEVLRATVNGGPYSAVGTVSGQATVTYDDSSVASSTTYYYVVKATKLLWRSANSNQASITTPSALCV